MDHKILLVEDDASLAEIIVFNLELAGYDIDHLVDGDIAWKQLQYKQYDLVLLDVMLPGLSGLEICRRLREQNPAQAIVMLTSLSSEYDRVNGLEIGADDYLVKPFSVRELQARVKALLRRIEIQAKPVLNNTIHCGGLSIDLGCHRVESDGQTLDLTAKEFELLSFLAREPGRVYRREQLLQQVWGYQFSGYEHTVNTHINRLRNKLGGKALIETVWGVGYRFNSEAA